MRFGFISAIIAHIIIPLAYDFLGLDLEEFRKNLSNETVLTIFTLSIALSSTYFILYCIIDFWKNDCNFGQVVAEIRGLLQGG